MTMTIPVTDSQCVVLELTSEGLLAKQVAAHLGISVETVKWHLRQARINLDARNTTHAVAIYLRQRKILQGGL